MKQSEMLATLKELRSDLMRYAAGSDSIVPGAYAEALDAAIETLERIRWRCVSKEVPQLKFLWDDAVEVLEAVSTDDGFRYISIGYYHPWIVNPWERIPGIRTTHWAYLPKLPEEDEMTPEIKRALEVWEDESNG